MTPFAQFLSNTTTVSDLSAIASAWHDQTVSFSLKGAATAVSPEFGNHIRRSFLGALGRGASEAAAKGRPCTWDPPCALDVFLREQIRGPHGDGLPKPYVIAIDRQGRDMIVSLTVFGMACEWFYLAAEALTDGVRRILPWEKATRGRVPHPPEILDRVCSVSSGLDLSAPPSKLLVNLASPLDISRDKSKNAAAFLGKALRRVDALARWQGLSLDADAGREIAIQLKGAVVHPANISAEVFESPNAERQKRKQTVLRGSFSVESHLELTWPLLRLAERSHIGRGATQGLGKIDLQTLT